MRTVIAPLSAEAEQDLAALDDQLAEIARRYIRRLALDPQLGAPVGRGLLADHGCRRLYFDRGDRPDDLFGARRPRKRRGDQDLSVGPAWRLVYWAQPAPLARVRLVVVLAVGRGHTDNAGADAYRLAARRLRRLITAPTRKGGAT